ncbi:antibiotic biosynthesis monooxygenase family protein [Cellvibrio fontiphilus]|uniref:Antibiotic biosynthesis monooxygenase family protein n=1 Tax=Cellvibrio fontiphilus TaxID=1815559 RepID=A0ABV7F906_9GAMM
MYSATFIFKEGDFNEEFFKLDKEIAEAAKNSVGYLGEESWMNNDAGLVSNVYYWESMDGLKELMNNPSHNIAKAKQGEWLKGYQVVISQVLRTYGDGTLDLPIAKVPPL